MNTLMPPTSHKSTERTVCLQQGHIKDDSREHDSLISMKLELENKHSTDVLWVCCAWGGKNEPKIAAIETGG